jgi:hypothetical protein
MVPGIQTSPVVLKIPNPIPIPQSRNKLRNPVMRDDMTGALVCSLFNLGRALVKQLPLDHFAAYIKIDCSEDMK